MWWWWWLSYPPMIHRHWSNGDLGSDLYVQQDPCGIRGRLQNPVWSGTRECCGEYQQKDQKQWNHWGHLQYWPCNAGKHINDALHWAHANKTGL